MKRKGLSEVEQIAEAREGDFDKAVRRKEVEPPRAGARIENSEIYLTIVGARGMGWVALKIGLPFLPESEA